MVRDNLVNQLGWNKKETRWYTVRPGFLITLLTVTLLCVTFYHQIYKAEYRDVLSMYEAQNETVLLNFKQQRNMHLMYKKAFGLCKQGKDVEINI